MGFDLLINIYIVLDAFQFIRDDIAATLFTREITILLEKISNKIELLQCENQLRLG